MQDNAELLERVPSRGLFAELASVPANPPQDEEESCSAFGFLRGIRDRALAIEFRLASGNSEWFAYSHLASWRFDPSVGLLLRFTADTVTLVLIRGSNLSAFVGEHSMNLTDRGIQRHRVTYIREMDEDELRRAGEGQPTIDRIEIAEFNDQEELQEWLKKSAPAFVRQLPLRANSPRDAT